MTGLLVWIWPASPVENRVSSQAIMAYSLVDSRPGGEFWAQNPQLRAVPIRAWQVWNEPNVPFYWSRQPFAAGYVKLLKAARAAIRAADPKATVLLAGMTNGARSPSWVALRMILRAGGRGQFDAVALHPYTSKVSNILRTVRYAVEHGYQEIRTGNDATNAPMLRINEALGYRDLSLVQSFEKRFV